MIIRRIRENDDESANKLSGFEPFHCIRLLLMLMPWKAQEKKENIGKLWPASPVTLMAVWIVWQANIHITQNGPHLFNLGKSSQSADIHIITRHLLGGPYREEVRENAMKIQYVCTARKSPFSSCSYIEV